MNKQPPNFCLIHNRPHIDDSCPLCDDPLEEAAERLKPKRKTATELGIAGIHGVKNENYGPAKEEFEKMSQIHDIIWEEGGFCQCESGTISSHPLYMIILKVLREVNCHKQDNLTDIIGYAQLIDDSFDNK